MPAAIETPTEALLDGRYRLIELVGRGGTANVYRAEDTMLQRTVALKLLRSADGDSAPPERAYRETGILACLSHPALVTLLDAQIAPGRPQYLVMEFVDGPTLASLMAAGVLAPATVAGIAVDIAGALEACHTAGVIHRDVKPSNILLAPPMRPEGRRRAKLTDFGISRSGDDVQVTSPGVVIGTAAYMAPEQVRGDALTPATDVYSLGLVLLEALTGTPAFVREGRVPTALARLTSSPEIPLSLGPRWTALLSRMTASDPAVRPQAGEVHDAARALLEEAEGSPDAIGPLPVAAPRAPSAATDLTTEPLPSMDTAAEPHSSRRRLILLPVCAAVLLALGTGIWAASSADDSPPRLSVSLTQRMPSTPPDAPSAPPSAETVSPADDQTQDPPAAQKDDNSNKGPGNYSHDGHKPKGSKKGR